MVNERLEELLNALEASGSERYRLEPELRRVMAEMRAAGQPIPQKLRDLDDQLQDEAFEADIDNMPI